MPKVPGINHQDAVRALVRAGFHILRQGKHIIMTDGVRVITIPRNNPSTPSQWVVLRGMPG